MPATASALAVGGLALLLSLPAPAVHGARLLARNTPVTVTFVMPLEYGRVLVPVLRGASTLTLERDHVALRTPAGSVGFLEVRSPQRASDLGQMLLPRALDSSRPEATRLSIAWRATIERERGYFGVVDVEGDGLNVQATASGLLVTEVARGATTSRSVGVPAGTGWHEWELRRGPDGTQLSLDGQVVWSSPAVARLERVRLGESRSDAEHGGTFRLGHASVTRSAA